MIYKIEMFNAIFYIIAKNAEEKEVIDIWWQYFIQAPERGESIGCTCLSKGS